MANKLAVAALCLFAAAPLAAQDTRAQDGALPQGGPVLNTGGGQSLTPTPGGLKTNTQINTQTGGAGAGVDVQTPNAGAGSLSATSAQAEAGAGRLSQPNAGLNSGSFSAPRDGLRPGAAPGAGPSDSSAPGSPRKTSVKPQGAKATPRNLTKSVGAISKAASAPGGGATAGLAELNREFDSAAMLQDKVAGPAGSGASPALSGRLLEVRDTVMHNVRLAGDPSTPPADVPGLLLDGVKKAREALPAAAAEKIAASITAVAAEKAKTSLDALGNSAYESASAGTPAGEEAVRRAVGPRETTSDIGMRPATPSAFDQWQELLGRADSPLIANLARLKRDVWRVYDEAVKPGSGRPAWISRRLFKEQDGAYAAVLGGSSVARLDETAAEFPLGPLGGPEPGAALAAYRRDPTPANGLRAVRDRAGLSAAVAFWLKAEAMSLWQSLLDRVLSLLGRGPAQSLAKLARASRADEPPAAASVSYADFLALDGPYLSAQSLLSRPGGLTVGAARRALAQASRLAEAASAVTFSGAGTRAVARLRARAELRLQGLADDAPAPADAVDVLRGEGGVSYWLERVRTAAFDRLDRGAFERLTAENKHQLVLADLSGTAPMIRVYLNGDGTRAAADLAALGYRVSTAGGSARAVWDWDDGGDARAALQQAASLLNGSGDTNLPQTADAGLSSRLVAAYLGRKAKNQLAQIEAADPGFSRFVPVSIVRSGARGYWVERSRGRLDGRLQDLFVVRDLRSRRPLFGQAAAVPAR